MAIHSEGIAQGIMMYPSTGSADSRRGDHIIISPPYNVNEEDLNLITKKAINAANVALEKITSSSS